MSIAVSAVVSPSRLLLLAVAGMCIGITLSAGVIVFSSAGDFPQFFRIFIAAGCILAAFSGFCWFVWTRKTFRIDISDIGQIWLGEYNGSRGFPSLAEVVKGEMVQLRPDSTIWPHFLLLRLRSEDNQITILPILRDCVGSDTFRALSIACRWIAAQNTRAENEQS